GVGFRPDTLDKLFEAFYTTKNDGMGIGLSVSRSIIEAHQGRLWATANEGAGATFFFSIPCNPETAATVHGLRAGTTASLTANCGAGRISPSYTNRLGGFNDAAFTARTSLHVRIPTLSFNRGGPPGCVGMNAPE